eukprot:3157484-Rhodomonas_salina.2
MCRLLDSFAAVFLLLLFLLLLRFCFLEPGQKSECSLGPRALSSSPPQPPVGGRGCFSREKFDSEGDRNSQIKRKGKGSASKFRGAWRCGTVEFVIVLILRCCDPNSSTTNF